MTRTTITPTNKSIIVEIPDDYVGKQVEVLVYALDEVKGTEKKMKIADFAGALKLSKEQYQDFQQHLQNIRNEWE